MLKITHQKKNTYGVLDTDDNSIEYYTFDDLVVLSMTYNLEIQGFLELYLPVSLSKLEKSIEYLIKFYMNNIRNKDVQFSNQDLLIKKSYLSIRLDDFYLVLKDTTASLVYGSEELVLTGKSRKETISGVLNSSEPYKLVRILDNFSYWLSVNKEFIEKGVVYGTYNKY